VLGEKNDKRLLSKKNQPATEMQAADAHFLRIYIF
jgi:hypothetical protein